MNWREVFVAQFEALSLHLPEVSEAKHINLRQDNWCPGQESNWAPSAFEQQAICFEPLCFSETVYAEKYYGLTTSVSK